MAKFDEQTFTNWTKPPSDSEQTRLENSERMVRQAIDSDKDLRIKSIQVFCQGSYANDTNVKLNSDIDINACYTDGFYYELPAGMCAKDLDISPHTSYSFQDFKNDIEKSLENKFGKADIIRKNKCITIIGNSYRTQTDVVPTWTFRQYGSNGRYEEGVAFFSDNFPYERTMNFPKQHIKNGKEKNASTHKRFKRLTRLLRKVRYEMVDDGLVSDEKITSFLIECLAWNVPNQIFNNYETWTQRLKESISYIFSQTESEQKCNEWGEVSELLYLFRGSRKWTYNDVNKYMQDLWTYLEF